MYLLHSMEVFLFPVRSVSLWHCGQDCLEMPDLNKVCLSLAASNFVICLNYFSKYIWLLRRVLLHGFPYLSSSVVKPTRRHSHPVSLRRRAFFVSLILTDSFPHLALFRFTSSSLCLSRSSPSFVMCRAVLIYVPRLPPPRPEHCV